jgi:hypothetical protein
MQDGPIERRVAQESDEKTAELGGCIYFKRDDSHCQRSRTRTRRPIWKGRGLGPEYTAEGVG